MATPDILITPGAGTMAFTGSVTGTMQLRVAESGALHFEGDQGSLLTITDDLSDSLFSVNDAAGMPVFEVFADDTIKSYRNNESKLEIDPDNNRIRLRDNTYISGDLIVSGDITSTSASHESTSYTASTHVSGLSGYFGKVGIGTSTNATPERPLVVQGTSMGGMPQGGIVRLADGDADGATAIAYMEFGGAGTAWNRHSYIGNAGGADNHLWIVNEETDGDVIFYAGNNERARITAGGDFGITGELKAKEIVVKDTVPVIKLESSNSQSRIDFKDGTNTQATIGLNDTHGDSFNIALSSSSASLTNDVKLIVKQDGNVGIGTTNPAELLTISGANATVRINTPITADSDTAAYTFGINVAADLAGMKFDYTDRVASGLALFAHPAYGYPISITPSTDKDIILNLDGGNAVLKNPIDASSPVYAEPPPNLDFIGAGHNSSHNSKVLGGRISVDAVYGPPARYNRTSGPAYTSADIVFSTQDTSSARVVLDTLTEQMRIGGDGAVYVPGRLILSEAYNTYVGGASLVVSGDASISGELKVAGALLPSANGTHNLGSPSAYWRNAYLEDTAINGTLYVGGDVTITQYIKHHGDTDTFFGFPSNQNYVVRTNATDRFLIDNYATQVTGQLRVNNHVTIQDGGLTFLDASKIEIQQSNSDIEIRANNYVSLGSYYNGNWQKTLVATNGRVQISPAHNAAAQAMFVVSGDASISGELRVNGQVVLPDAYAYKWGAGDTWIQGSSAGDEIKLITNSSPRFAVDNTATQVTGQLRVNSTSYFAGDVYLKESTPILYFQDTDTAQIASIRHIPSTTRLAVFGDSSTELFSVQTEGGTTAGDTFISGYVGIGSDPGSSYKLNLKQNEIADNRTIAKFEGVANSATTTGGGQYLSVMRGGPIGNAANNTAGGILLGISASIASSNCGIRGTYEYTNGRDLQFFTSEANAGSPVNRMSIKGNGRVGIGTQGVIRNPQALLTVDGDASITGELRTDGNVGIGIAPTNAALQVKVAADQNLRVRADGSALQLTARNDGNSADIPFYLRGSLFNFQIGNVGIGTATPSWELDVGHATTNNHVYINVNAPLANTAGYLIESAGSLKWQIMRPANRNDFVIFDQQQSNEAFTILGNKGHVGIDRPDPTGRLHVYQSGDAIPAFLVEGSQGSLFSVEDSLTGSLMSVNDIAGLPVFEAFDDGTIVMGQYNSGDFVITGNQVGIGMSPADVGSSSVLNIQGGASQGLHIYKSDGATLNCLLEPNASENATLYLKDSGGTTRTQIAATDYSYINGNLQIGVTAETPGSKLLVDGDVGISGQLKVGNGTNGGLIVKPAGTDHALKVYGAPDKGISMMDATDTHEILHMRQEAGDSAMILFKDGGNNKILLTSRPSSHSWFNVDSANLGIGTSNPTQKLVVHQGNIGVTDNYLIGDIAGQNAMMLGYHGGNGISWQSSSADSMFLDAGGQLGVGIRLPSGILHAELDGTGIIVANKEVTGNAFEVHGAQGNLLTITDDLSDSLMSVNDAAGMPVFEVFADDTIKSYRNNESKFEIDPDNNRIRLRDNADISGNLYVSGHAEVYGNLTCQSTIFTSSLIKHLGDNDTQIEFLADRIKIHAGGEEMINIEEQTHSQVVINDDGGNINFRAESDNNQFMLFVDAGNDCVGIGGDTSSAAGAALLVNGDVGITGTTRIKGSLGVGQVGPGGTATVPDREFHVSDGNAGSVVADSSTQAVIESSAHAGLQFLSPATASASILFGDPDSTSAGFVSYVHGTSQDYLWLGAAGAPRTAIDSSATQVTGDLRVHGDANPSRDDECDLGTTVLRWRRGYFNDIYAYGTPEGTGVAADTQFLVRNTSDSRVQYKRANQIIYAVSVTMSKNTGDDIVSTLITVNNMAANGSVDLTDLSVHS